MYKNELRTTIIEILDQSGLEHFGNKIFFLRDDDGEDIEFKDEETNVILVSDDNFKLVITAGEVVLETSYSNQKITDEWLNKLNSLKKVRDIIDWELNGLI